MKIRLYRFSLIELIVVIAIFMILGSLLAPSLKTVLRKTHILNCKTTMVNISNSMLLYSSDEDEHYTPNVKPSSPYHSSPEKVTWDDYLATYDGREAPSSWLNGWGHFNKQRKVPEWDQYTCPSDTRGRVMDVFNGGALGIRRDYDITKGQEITPTNGVKSLVGIAGSGGWSARTYEVNKPSDTFILAERVGPRFIGYPFHAGMARANDHNVIKDGTILHEKDFYNYLYADGHIEYLYYLDPVTDSNGQALSLQNTPWNYERP